MLESGSDRSPVDARRVGDRPDNFTSVGVDNLDLSEDELAEIDRYPAETDINIWAESSA